MTYLEAYFEQIRQKAEELKKKMTFEEYKSAVEKELKDRPIVKQYPQEYRKVFNEEIEELYKEGETVESAAYFIDLMI